MVMIRNRLNAATYNQEPMPTTERAELYSLLAELLAEPPEWMCSPGREWPLPGLLTGTAKESEAMGRRLASLAVIPGESLYERRHRYASLFAVDRPRFWLYESAVKTGKILGAPTFEMAKLYRAAGLEANGAELPDHISLELTFLAHLAEQSEDPSYEKQFLAKHGDWMIDLGRGLQQTGDLVYAPIGAVLADWITEQSRSARPNLQKSLLMPLIANPDECTLCGFCAQVCPTHALNIMEDPENDFLSLKPAECIQCGKCERICEFRAMKMSIPGPEMGREIILRKSPRMKCPSCGRPVASQAEMAYIVSKIGEAAWQKLCPECRAGSYN